MAEIPQIPEWQDIPFLNKNTFPPWREALEKVHFPKDENDVLHRETYRRRLAYDELLAAQLSIRLVREKNKREAGIPLHIDEKALERFIQSLPFELTGAQKKVIGEIKNDLSGNVKMSRLLQGDVGSGKTLVAVAAMVMGIGAGYQTAIMAPTDILARQHFGTMQKLFANRNINVQLLTGREMGKKRAGLIADLAAGKIDVLVGTHALFVEDVAFQKLGLVVIDEQHKFGVHQRLALGQKQKGAHMLAMTATPIPRTLALTTYGDMDISVLDEKPAGRQPIETKVMPIAKVQELSLKLKDMLAAAKEKTQVYWVCPLIEESEKSDLMAAEKRYESLKKIFGGKVALIHGRMKPDQKEEVMEKFIAGDTDVLVSTTVIEVGVDVKSASIMVIEHAERFGLSGLHQLRGRIGRGNNKSTCILLYGANLSETAKKRLEIMRASQDGFYIAEEDLKLRGSGEVLGAKQSGFPEYRMADLSKDSDLLWTATKDAGMILNADPKLTAPRGQALRLLLYLFQKDKQLQTINAG
jgi:ATP-dependent DNA helicase RecG